MTLRITLEIIPSGDEYKRHVIEVVNISNVTGGENSEYVIEHNDYKNYVGKNVPKVRHNRTEGALKLAYLALGKLIKQ